jgi:hypothetical protein
MPRVVKYGRCKPENKEIALETLTNGEICLYATSRAYPLRKDT